MKFHCPSCQRSYTLEQCYIPSNPGTHAAVMCQCGHLIRLVIIMKVTETSVRRFYFWRRKVRHEALAIETS